MLLQLPSPTPGAIENWLLCFAVVTSLFLLFKKVFLQRRGGLQPPTVPSPITDHPFVTKTELHHELSAAHDKLDARFLALTEKIDALGTSLHCRLNQLEAGLARVDERTKKP
jgi:hypothetical protein